MFGVWYNALAKPHVLAKHTGPRTSDVPALCARCAKQPGSRTPVPRSLPLLLETQVPQEADTQPGAAAPYVAPRAVLPLFRFRPPLPCPWAAALLGSVGAWLLTWLLALASKCGRPALHLANYTSQCAEGGRRSAAVLSCRLQRAAKCAVITGCCLRVAVH